MRPNASKCLGERISNINGDLGETNETLSRMPNTPPKHHADDTKADEKESITAMAKGNKCTSNDKD